MSDVGNIKPTGPVRPQPAVEKVRKQEDAKDRQHSRRERAPHRDDDDHDDEGGGIDEYA